jgi:hypothetical protein
MRERAAGGSSARRCPNTQELGLVDLESTWLKYLNRWRHFESNEFFEVLLHNKLICGRRLLTASAPCMYNPLPALADVKSRPELAAVVPWKTPTPTAAPFMQCEGSLGTLAPSRGCRANFFYLPPCAHVRYTGQILLDPQDMCARGGIVCVSNFRSSF